MHDFVLKHYIIVCIPRQAFFDKVKLYLATRNENMLHICQLLDSTENSLCNGGSYFRCVQNIL